MHRMMYLSIVVKRTGNKRRTRHGKYKDGSKLKGNKIDRVKRTRYGDIGRG